MMSQTVMEVESGINNKYLPSTNLLKRSLMNRYKNSQYNNQPTNVYHKLF